MWCLWYKNLFLIGWIGIDVCKVFCLLYCVLLIIGLLNLINIIEGILFWKIILVIIFIVLLINFCLVLMFFVNIIFVFFEISKCFFNFFVLILLIGIM